MNCRAYNFVIFQNIRFSYFWNYHVYDHLHVYAQADLYRALIMFFSFTEKMMKEIMKNIPEPQQRLHGDSVPSTIEGKQGNPDEDLPSFLTYDNPDTADPSR